MSGAPKQIHLNAFEMNCLGHLARGMWRHPRDTRDRFNDLEHWTKEAILLEQGLFDTIFIADVLGTYETAPGDSANALRIAHQVPRNDPLLIVPAMALVTKHLGFAVTVSTTYEPPFGHAQRMSTVDHLTKGRLAWNVVTSYLNNAARNFGLEAQMAHDDRYGRADEFLEVCYKLWEGSWDDGAVLNDRENGIFSDPEKVHYIDHVGQDYKVSGPHLAQPSPQRTPVIIQATASARGKAFAGKHAEQVFLGSASLEQTRDDIAEIRAQAVAHGREPDDVKIATHLRVITGKTRAAAHAKAEEYAKYRSTDLNFMGVDLRKYDLSTPVGQIEVSDDGSGRDRGGALRAFAKELPGATVADVIARVRSVGSLGPFAIVGAPDEIAERIAFMVEFTDLDGFNLHSHVTPESYEEFIELVVPALQKRGLFRTRYEPAGTTLRERLFGAGQKLLPDRHPGAKFRGAFAKREPLVPA